MLQFVNYSKSYNQHLVLQVPELILPHDLYWLKGGNGSGKTTLIKSISGLIPFDGSIQVDRTAINKERVLYRLKVNYAEAEPLYPDFLTGNDLVQFYKKTKKASDAQILQLTEALGVGSYIGNKVGTYSSGMTKKLSLVLGLMGQPKLILLDEPLITLDQQTVAALQHILEDYYRDGITLLITSHQEITFAGKFSCRLAVRDKTIALV